MNISDFLSYRLNMTLSSVVDRSDLIKTIDDDQEIEVEDDSSDDEDVAQPKKNKAARQAKKDFEPEFSFVSSQQDYMKDTWDDLAKYVKKKARTNLDDKIAKIRNERKEDTAGDVVLDSSDDSSEEEISDDEMVEDRVRVKENDMKRKSRRSKRGEDAADTGIDIQVEL